MGRELPQNRFVRSEICRRLPSDSDSTSRWTPLTMGSVGTVVPVQDFYLKAHGQAGRTKKSLSPRRKAKSLFPRPRNGNHRHPLRGLTPGGRGEGGCSTGGLRRCPREPINPCLCCAVATPITTGRWRIWLTGLMFSDSVPDGDLSSFPEAATGSDILLSLSSPSHSSAADGLFVISLTRVTLSSHRSRHRFNCTNDHASDAGWFPAAHKNNPKAIQARTACACNGRVI